MMCFRSQSRVSFQFLIMPANQLKRRRLSLSRSLGPGLRVTATFVQEALIKRLYETVPSSHMLLESSSPSEMPDIPAGRHGLRWFDDVACAAGNCGRASGSAGQEYRRQEMS